jgi:hypothetical protein
VLTNVFTLLLTTLAPGVFREDGGTDHTGMLLLLVALSVGYSMVAAYVTASIAKGDVMRHVWVLAFVDLAIGIGVEAAYWGLFPAWFHLIFLALVVPAHLYGGRLRLAHRLGLG